MKKFKLHLKMKQIYKLLTLLLVVTVMPSCKKTTKPVAPEPMEAFSSTPTGSLQLEFEAMAGDSDLLFSTKTYTNQAGNTFNITMFRYYISNVKITKNDNTVWAEPNSYHLVDHTDASTTAIKIQGVPYSDYKAIEFMIGVDSASNVSGAQSGDLDPAKGMFWSWNSGYIMAKMEGTSPQSSATDHKLTVHVGGFSGTNSVLKVIAPSFNGSMATVTSAVTPKIRIKSDMMQWFQSPNSINFSTLNTVHMPGTDAKKISDNYADMFSISYIHNN